MTLVTTIAICGFIGVFGYNRYCGSVSKDR